MSNPTFTTAAAGSPAPDPSKHVNYTQGMVLGVDDFQQEFAYLSNRDQWLARDAIGYGTVCGLHVSIDSTDNSRLSVSPGVAINPRGQLIRVTPEQCAKLDAWLALPDTVGKLQNLGIGGSGEFSAYVVLCYRDCPADELPVPGEPCRCDSTTMAPSRIIDDFRLELTLDRPLQLEEDVVRSLVEWLRRIPVVEDFDSPPADLDAFLQAIKDAFSEVGSPPEAPTIFFEESPPDGLSIPRSQFCEWMRAAMRLWVTELRHIWQARCAPRHSCACGGPCGCHGTGAEPENMDCECLLLAEVAITRTGGAITGAIVDESRRPFLVHLRMLQELLLCGPCCGEGDSVTPGMSAANAQQLFVEHPNNPNAGRYFIVAAGRFAVRVQSNVVSVSAFGPSYNNLRAAVATPAAPGEFLLTFGGGGLNPAESYVPPGSNPNHNYIVKGTPFGPSPGSFHVISMTAAGIRIRAAQASNAPVSGFMIEISFFGRP